jgi:hypothetical protein
MPNWCNNTLTVSGSHDEVRRFIAAARGREHSYNDFNSQSWEAFDEIRLASIVSTPPEDSEREVDLSFHRLYPVPADVRSWPYDDGVAAKIAKITGLKPPDEFGYYWENRHWGVKWGASDSHLNDLGDSAEYSFDTAWGPPMEWMHHVASEWPTLDFSLKYEEPGMCFRGDAQWEGGECIYHDQYQMTEEEDFEEEEYLENQEQSYQF